MTRQQREKERSSGGVAVGPTFTLCVFVVWRLQDSLFITRSKRTNQSFSCGDFLCSVAGREKNPPDAFINNKSRFTAVRNMAEQFFQLNSAQISLVVAAASLNRPAALYLLAAPALSLSR